MKWSDDNALAARKCFAIFQQRGKRKLKKTAEKYNISMSECLRDMVLFGNPKVVDPLKGVDTESYVTYILEAKKDK